MSEEKQPYLPSDILQQVFLECRAMAEYSFANGLPVPIDVAGTIEQFATAEGDEKPGLDRLVAAHQALSSLIKPALPRTILLLDREQKSDNMWNFLGPVSTIRQMMMASFISIACFILLALFPEVNVGGGNILQSHGL